MQNSFTVSLPISEEQIDEIAELNKSIKKSKVSSFHSALPDNLPENTGLEYNVNCDPGMTARKFYSLIEYAAGKGIQFTYLLNSICGLQLDTYNYREVYPKLEDLLNNLRRVGCHTIKVANPTVIQYLRDMAPDFDLVLSTIAGYKDINQYRNFISLFPKIKKIVMTTDSMKNIPLLKNIQKLGIEVIYMTNEGCVEGCPLRYAHYIFPPSTFKDVNISEYCSIEQYCFWENCKKMKNSNLMEYIIKANIVYPHQISTYNSLGVHEFKIAGRLSDKLRSGFQLQFIKDYLTMVDNPELSYDEPALRFNRSFWGYLDTPSYENYVDIRVKDILQFLPDINYFIEHGNRCNSECGFECNYCNNKAKKLEEWIKNKALN